MNSLLLLLAPALFAASIYMVLARLIVLTGGEQHSPIRVKWLTKIFVAGDVISFLAQSAVTGGAMLSNAKSTSDTNTGENVITVGLALQVLFFDLFIIVTTIFNLQLRAFERSRSQQSSVPWQSYLLVLYAASLMIMIRSVFRIAEYVLGQDGFLLKHEVFIYIFDATLMFLTMVLFAIFHPGAIISKKKMGDMGSMDSGYVLQEENAGMKHDTGRFEGGFKVGKC